MTTVAGHPSRLRVALTWLAGNALIGYFWIFPLGAVDGLVFYLRARIWNDVVPLYGQDGAIGVAVLIAFASTVLVGCSVLFNRRQARRAGFPARRETRLVGALATVVVQLLPFAGFLLFTDRTVPPFF
ncbi:hypothetical protein ACIBQ2_20930 [Micromonospora sediminimaris]|uniref:hypothetical protein n=1 Tax=Micromonospora sediminimaris TaxID=547162 RepID=UPI0037B94DAA